MKLVDTSSWTQFLRRKGNQPVRDRVKALLDKEEAAWCQMVRLELWRGANNDWDKKLLEYMEGNVKMLAISHDVWQRSIFYGQELRASGYTIPTPDLVIFACGAVHEVEIEHNDHHFDLMRQTVTIY